MSNRDDRLTTPGALCALELRHGAPTALALARLVDVIAAIAARIETRLSEEAARDA